MMSSHPPLELASRCRARRGVALVMAVVAMAVLGVLVAGVFFTALREQRDGHDAVHRVQALASAEYGLAATLSPETWRPEWNGSTRRGLLYLNAFDPAPDAADTVRIWKLEQGSFLLVSTGVAGPASSPAFRRIGLLVALRIPWLGARAAVIARDGAWVGDSSRISGIDTVPPHWSCPPEDVDRPAVIVPAVTSVSGGECTAKPCLVGAPPVSADVAAAGPEMYERFGTRDRDSIAAFGVQLAGDAAILAPAPALDRAGECDVTRPDVLGDPLRLLGEESPCADHFPLIHAPGNMRIEGGTGEGLLIVDGDLTIAGGAYFSGVAAVRGVLEITGASALHGTALASRVMVRGGSLARYSSCAVERALRAAALPVVPEGMAWSEMY